LNNIRLTRTDEVDTCMKIWDIARNRMRSEGNNSQWINGYPSKDQLLKDIENGNSYVLTDNEDKPVAVWAFIKGVDHTYLKINGSGWLNDEPYGTIHRIGTDGTVFHVLKKAVEYHGKEVKNIRIDTHATNAHMQKTVTSIGFVYCGEIFVDDGTPRNAYHLVIK